MNHNDKKDTYVKIIKILIIIVFSFCLIFIGFYLGKKIYQIKRKLRANELEDNYEYINENDNNKDLNNKIINENKKMHQSKWDLKFKIYFNLII
jgi:predicted Holliday junction resolvase-like endonuclease